MIPWDAKNFESLTMDYLIFFKIDLGKVSTICLDFDEELKFVDLDKVRKSFVDGAPLFIFAYNFIKFTSFKVVCGIISPKTSLLTILPLRSNTCIKFYEFYSYIVFSCKMTNTVDNAFVSTLKIPKIRDRRESLFLRVWYLQKFCSLFK